jgi:hypothetical protein
MSAPPRLPMPIAPPSPNLASALPCMPVTGTLGPYRDEAKPPRLQGNTWEYVVRFCSRATPFACSAVAHNVIRAASATIRHTSSDRRDAACQVAGAHYLG